MRAATAWLLERAGGRPQGHRAVALMLGLMARRPGTRLADLCEATGYGERQVRNLFWTWVGVGPKRYQRIVRFQGVLRSLAQSGGDAAFDPWLETGRIDMPCWADVASAFGYADQSHLSADFKALAGVTPGGYVAAYRGLENYLPVHLDRKPPGVA
jgi:AraC-like DNA-binding protein